MRCRFLLQLFFYITLLSLAESWWLPRSFSGTSRSKNRQTKSSNILDIARNNLGSTNWSLRRSWHRHLWYIKEDKDNIVVYNILIKAHKFAPKRRSQVPFSIAEHLLIRRSLDSTNSTSELTKKTKRSSKRTKRSYRRTSGSTRSNSRSNRRTSGSFRRTSGSFRRTSGSTRRALGSLKRTAGSTRRTNSWLRRRTTASKRRPTGSTRRTNSWLRRRTTGSKGRPTGSTRRKWSRRSSSRRTYVESSQTTKSSKILESARNRKGSTKWRVWNTWGWKLNYFGKNKCNLFVYDVLTESGAKTPNRKPGKTSPIGANEWANPESTYVKNTGCYRVVSNSNMERGDIIAFGRDGMSGHVGIVSTGGYYISAGDDRIVEKPIPKKDPFIIRTTVWRYTC